MTRIPSQEQALVPHRFGNEAPQGGNALFDGRAGDEGVRQGVGQTPPELFPESLIRPVRHLVVQGALDIVTAEAGRAHAAKREPAGMPGIDDLIVHRRCLGQEAHPAEGIDALVHPQHRVGNGPSAGAVVAVAARDKFAFERVILAAGPVTKERPVFFQGIDTHILGFIDQPSAAGIPCVHQVPGDLRLPVDHDRTAGQLPEIDTVNAVVEGNAEAMVHHALPVHAFAHTGLAHEFHHAPFQDPGSDPPENILPGTPFQDHIVDPVPVEQLGQEQSGRTGSDDADLCAFARHCPL